MLLVVVVVFVVVTRADRVSVLLEYSSECLLMYCWFCEVKFMFLGIRLWGEIFRFTVKCQNVRCCILL